MNRIIGTIEQSKYLTYTYMLVQVSWERMRMFGRFYLRIEKKTSAEIKANVFLRFRSIICTWILQLHSRCSNNLEKHLLINETTSIQFKICFRSVRLHHKWSTKDIFLKLFFFFAIFSALTFNSCDGFFFAISMDGNHSLSSI